jgi:hypothetical protein
MIKNKEALKGKIEGKDWTVEDLIDADYGGFKTNYKAWNSPKEFSSPFQALDWCYRNPMKEIEYKYEVKGSERNIKIKERFNKKEKRFEYKFISINEEWQEEDCYLTDMLKWKNIKEHREEEE